MTSRTLILVTDEHTVAAVCECKIATAAATLMAQQAAKASKSASRVAEIVEMMVSGPVKKTNCTTFPQQIVQVEFGL